MVMDNAGMGTTMEKKDEKSNNSMGIVFCIASCFFAMAVNSVCTSELDDF